MIPELYPIASRLFVNHGKIGEIPLSTEASDLVDFPEFNPKHPWIDLVAVTPIAAIVGSGTREKVPVGYQRLTFNVSIPYGEKWPSDLNADDSKEVLFALLQKREVLIAYTFTGRVVAVNVFFQEDHWVGTISLHAHHVKKLLDRVV